jgi:adenylate cyclase
LRFDGRGAAGRHPRNRWTEGRGLRQNGCCFRGAVLAQDIEIERRLAAVLVADVAGFSRLTEADEIGTMRLLAAQRAILDSAISRHRGRIANTAGDSVLAEFPSAVNAVRCAVEAQQALREAAEGVASDRRILFRIGIHVGDVMVRDGDLLGTGVNVAARLEALADAGGIVLSAAAHEQVRKILPLAYTDLGSQSVKNIDEPMRAFAIGSVSAASTVRAPFEPDKPLPLPDKPSIAVLPFQNMSGDPEQEYFADGVVEDIITELSRYKSLFVIARNSSFTYKGKPVDIKQIGRELGVRYVLEGSVRKAGGRVRITGQLIDSITGAHVWADRFDREMSDIFALQDDVTRSVVTAVEPNLRSAEVARKNSVPTQDLSAYDLCLRARASLGTTAAESMEAEPLLRRAVDLDPTYSDAWAMLADALALPISRGLRTDPEAKEELVKTALMAIKVGPDNGLALAMAGGYLAMWGGPHELDRGVDLAKRALALHPNSDEVRTFAGWALMFSGELDAALEHLEAGLRLSPVGPRVPRLMLGMMRVLFLQRDFAEVILRADKVHSRLSENPPYWRYRAAALAHLGRLDEAHDAVARLLRLIPAETISTVPVATYRHTWMHDLLLEGLRLAGLPE